MTDAPARPVSAAALGAAALVLAAWIGAALLAVAVVAPAAFGALPSRTLAGAVVGRVLNAVFLSGIAMSLVVAALCRFGPGVRGASAASLSAAAASAAVWFMVDPRIARLRERVGGPVDALAVVDARRVAFGRLHGYSVGGLGIAMLASAVALLIILGALRPGRRSA